MAYGLWETQYLVYTLTPSREVFFYDNAGEYILKRKFLDFYIWILDTINFSHFNTKTVFVLYASDIDIDFGLQIALSSRVASNACQTLYRLVVSRAVRICNRHALVRRSFRRFLYYYYYFGVKYTKIFLHNTFLIIVYSFNMNFFL